MNTIWSFDLGNASVGEAVCDMNFLITCFHSRHV